MVSSRRARFHAYRVLALVAADRRVVRENILSAGSVGVHFPRAALKLNHAAQHDIRRVVMQVTAGDGASPAAGAAGLIKIKSFLSHVSAPDIPASGLSHFNEDVVLRVAFRVRARTVSGERIDAAADVNPHPVHHCGLIPGALRFLS